MLVYAVVSALITFMGIILSPIPKVEALPFGMDEFVYIFMTHLNYASANFPFFDIALDVFLLGFAVEFTLFLIVTIHRFMKFIRG